MTLVNFKKYKNLSNNLLRYLLALVFISAGLFRLFNYETGFIEMQQLNLPEWLTWPISLFEILAGLALLKEGRGAKKAILALIGFLLAALIWALFLAKDKIIKEASELFIFNLTPTDFFLHLVFLLILISLIKKPHKGL